MKTMLNIKTDASVKRAAQQVAKDIGVPLSTIVNAQLKRFIAERQVLLRAPEIPNAKTRKLLDEALRDIREGNTNAFSPSFTNARDMDAWLDGAE